ncbi:MAG: hypothetical protein IPI29_00010 [Ignavibacteria bacterium]|nr:hypothetical protein [Ignavibacteria bacterium]
MTIASDGLVGIGTAPVATYQLALAGNQRFTAVGTLNNLSGWNGTQA